MRLVTCTAIAAALILTLPGCKQQPAAQGNEAASAEAAGDLTALNGTWKTDKASVKFEQKPDELMLKDGTYSCTTCIPPLTVAADGQFHAVTGRPYADEVSAKAADDKTIEIHSKKGGKEVSSLTMTVSADGNTLTRKFHDATVDPAIDGSSTSSRAGPAPAGAHAASGQWTPNQVAEYSEAALSSTYTITGNQVTWAGQGQTYTAEIGGPAVPVTGDIGGSTVAVTNEGGALKETFSRDGKVVNETVSTVSADGKSLTWVSSDPRDGSKVTGTAAKTN
ncbi:MAG: hypothetical protein HOP96_01090 [Sphingomonas sp.]|nr:hypothetical protein [Sphingomonas sp.]